MLGVIECKDLSRRVGTPEVDAFHTKATDINANFKVIASKRGFTNPALHKARHYGIRLVSLLDPEVLKREFAIGDWWSAKIFRWKRISILAYPVGTDQPIVDAAPEDICVNGGRVLDWFKNTLLKDGHNDQSIGWVVNFQLVFEPAITVSLKSKFDVVCGALSFHAERECLEYERFVPLSAEAFVDWHTKSASIPPNTTVAMSAVPMDFREWAPRTTERKRDGSFLSVSIEAHEHQFEYVPIAPDLEAL